MRLPHLINIAAETCCFYWRKYFAFRESKGTWIALLISFCVTFFAIFVSMEKISVIRKLKAEIISLQDNMNMLGWDIAYQHISFNTLFFSPIMEVKNLSLYHKENGISLTLPKVSINPSLLGFTEYHLSLNEHQTLATHNGKWEIDTQNSKASIKINNKKIDRWEANFNNIKINNFGTIKSITIAGRKTSGSLVINGPETFFENHIDIQNIAFANSIKHPLGNMIERIYLKTNTMQSETPSQTFNEWRQQNGYITVSNLIINWPPFFMAGKGELRFSDNNTPIIHMETSSQGLLTLLNDLQEQGIAERKNVFVANILLTNKAFKLKENDAVSTIVTPISYQNGNLNIENINICKF